MFIVVYAAQDRREMLEEIMRKGTSSLGTDVPSEREINRLAARSDEEFWLFEKMDEERRLKESYRSRLMEEHEVPDWAYTAPDTKDNKGKGFDFDAANVTGKRRRKEVAYRDTYDDTEATKAAVENGESARHSAKGKKRKEHPPPAVDNEVPNINNSDEDKIGQSSKKEPISVASKATRGHSVGLTMKNIKSEDTTSNQEDHSPPRDDPLNGLTWKAHKRRRSSLVS